METREHNDIAKEKGTRSSAEERLSSVSKVVAGMIMAFSELEGHLSSLQHTGLNEEQKQHTEDMAALNEKLQSAMHKLKDLVQPDQQSTAKPSEVEKVLAGTNVLLADDDDIIRMIAAKMLKRNGADVDVAVNGKEALALAMKKSYDIILLDAKMPEMNGLDAAWNIRQKDSVTPIICVTANMISDGDIAYADAGMNDTVTKPYNEKKLIGIVTKWIKRSKQPESNASLLYSISRLRAIGDDAFIARMLQLFAEQVPVAVKSIRQAYDACDFETIKYATHRIRPSILNMGIESLQTEVVDIEDLAEKGEKTPVLDAMISKLEVVIADVVAQIQEQQLTY